MNQIDKEFPHVVIVGGGFAGLYAARALGRASVRVTLIDMENYHLFQPLLYQVATAALNPSDIAYPLRAILRKQRNATVLLGKVESIHLDRMSLSETNGELQYDYLILATGASHSYFGNNQWARLAPGLKTVADALEIRRRVFLAYEAAERESHPARRQEWLTFVVIGGGPTGVELAGALAEIGTRTLARDFRRIDPTTVQVVLLEGRDRILSSYQSSMSEKAVVQLEKLGVTVVTNSTVSGITDSGVRIGDREIRSKTVLWAAGIQGSPLARSLNCPLDKAGRILVRPDLSIDGHPEVFVAGDLAFVESEGEPVPGVAPAAIQEGVHAARNVMRLLKNRDTTPFCYKDKGSLATIGRASAIAEFKSIHLSGFPAWISWLMIHVYFLIGFRNRLWVIFGWAWSYVTFQRGARLITGGNYFNRLPPIQDNPDDPDDPGNSDDPEQSGDKPSV